MMVALTARTVVFLLLLIPLGGCNTPQSALAGLGTESDRVLQLTWLMLIGATFIMALVLTLAGIAIYGPSNWRAPLGSSKLVVGLGIVFPIVILTALLVYGFALMRDNMPEPGISGPTRISVVGHQWWWRITYHHEDGTVTESANELYLRVNETVELALSSADVLHSFWVPAYAGKMDMIPGRSNTLRMTPREAGVVRGQCAEYCGGAHALMAFYVVAMESQEYESWMARERADAVLTGLSDDAEQGHQLFNASGCGGCHTIRGSKASGRIGPDLTHIGSRRTIGAATLLTQHGSFVAWLKRHQQIKPENRMPPYDFLSDTQRHYLATFLMGLE